MNIIIPEDSSVEYVIIDLRDSLNGDELNAYSKHNGLPENVFLVNKKVFAKGEHIPTAKKIGDAILTDGGWLADVVLNQTAAATQPECEYIYERLEKIMYNESYSIITMPKDKRRIYVGAPLWKSSVQLLEIEIEDVPGEFLDGEEQKFIKLSDGGIAPIDMAYQVCDNDFYPGFGVNLNKNILKNKIINSDKTKKPSKNKTSDKGEDFPGFEI